VSDDDLRVMSPAPARGDACVIDFEGAPTRAFTGESVAAALYAGGVRTLGRSTKYHRPRGAFCFEGHCASCLMRIDGKPNVRACLTPARPDLRCERQNAFPSADVDLLEAADWLFPHGMDHHRLLTGSRAANRVFVNLVRQVGGSGTLPDAPAASLPAVRDVLVDVCVVGAGPAGLAAAASVRRAAPDTRVLVVDDQSAPGGSWLAEPGGTAQAEAAVERAVAAGAELYSRAVAIGFFPEDVVPALAGQSAGQSEGQSAGQSGWLVGTLAVATPDGLVRIAARRIVYATGGADQNVPFLDNDRPGVISARACGRLAFRHGIRPGQQVAIVGDAPFGDRLAEALRAAGIPVKRVDGRRERPVAAIGGARLRALEVEDGSGVRRRIDADVIATAATPAPASELARQHGARVAFAEGDGGFAVAVDGTFQTGVPGVFACGDVTGFRGPQMAARQGEAAGREIAHTLR
jgi:sarcosine oxidase subunit alpha